MNKKFLYTILIIAILSIGFMHFGSIAAYNNGILSDENPDDYKIMHDDSDSMYNDVGYVDVNYSTNTNSDPVNYFFFGDTVDIYFDGESTTVSSNLDSNITNAASDEILNYVSNAALNSSADVDTIKEGVRSICHKYGSVDCTVNIDSIIGEDQIPLVFWAEGKSMLPTVQDGQFILVNKTHDIHVGEIVSADSKEYGGICKRVAKIERDNVYLVSDNKKVYYEEVDGVTYQCQGLRTWVDISEIDGVIIEY